MPRNRELYRGRKKRRPWLRIVLIILAVLITAALLLFYGLQKYIVYTPNGLKLELPILQQASGTDTAASSTDASGEGGGLVIDKTDYSNIQATAGADISAVKGILVPYDKITADGIKEYADRLSAGNALVLELKTASGKLAWASKEREATAFDLAGTADLKTIVASLKAEKPEVWLVGQLSCCIDDLMAQRNSPVALKKADGSPYSDDEGAWLDPYNTEVRDYIAALAKELADMGFDEILLTNVSHPQTDPANLKYSAASTNATAQSAVTSFSLAVTRALSGTDAVLSVVGTRAAITKAADNLNGQDIEVLMKLFDRVYCYTSASEYKTYMDDCAAYVTVGDIKTRFAPICTGNLPDTDCWVLAESAG